MDTPGKLLEYLALEKHYDRIRSMEVPSDGLTWTRFCGSLSLVLVVLLFMLYQKMVHQY